MERQAFLRARSFLKFSAGARALAYLAAIANAILYVALLAVLALFADLLIYRGQIPALRSLAAREQAPFAELAPADARAYLEDVGVEPAQATVIAQKEAAARSAWESDLIWRGYVAGLLEQRVGNRAADLFRASAQDEQTQPSFGVLGLVVRSRNQVHGRIASGLARWNRWMWQPAGGPAGAALYLGGLVAIAAILALLRAGSRLLLNYAAARAAIEAATRLRRAIYHHTFRLGNLAVKAKGTSEAIGIFTRHVEAVYHGLFSWLTVSFAEPIKFAAILCFALAVNFWLALASLFFALLVWLVGGRLAASFRQRSRLAMQEAAEQLALIQESLSMMRLVKSYQMELFNQARVERQLSRYGQAQMRRQLDDAVYQPILALLGTLAALVVLAAAGAIILNRQLNAASAITLAAALASLYWPLATWLGQRRTMRKARAAAVQVFGFLDQKSDVGQVVGAEFLPPMRLGLEFDSVTLRDPESNQTLLNEVSFSIPAGQRVALIGSDDTERHAIAYLLTRFLDPVEGKIRIDGKNLRWVTLDSLRTQIGLVLQNSLIFNDTVANNISCGDTSFVLPRVIEAAKIAHAHQFIQKLPQGYQTVIGEIGHPLPRSLQYLIALARALLRDPALFIIEEPAAGLSDDFKSLIDDTYARILPGRTTLFLPHRVSTIRSCNRILLFYRGGLAADGEHRELLSQNDFYRHLHYLEFNDLAEHMSA